MTDLNPIGLTILVVTLVCNAFAFQVWMLRRRRELYKTLPIMGLMLLNFALILPNIPLVLEAWSA